MEDRKYMLFDVKTGNPVGDKIYPYEKRNAARNRADRMNATYGAHRYAVMPMLANGVA